MLGAFSHKLNWIGIIIALVIFSSCQSSVPEHIKAYYEELPETVDFNFHVKPILSDRCFTCHGPDDEARKANLRLDIEDEAFAALESGVGRAFKRGHAMGSESISRMISTDQDYMMPPPESNLIMTEQEIATISKWVDQGAEWKAHWSFIKPVMPDVPEEVAEEWVNTNDIDHFIYQKIRENKLTPSKEAAKSRLLRRVYMDITGLPPSIEAIDEFIADDAEDAYEHVVDRLLASDAYAERMTMEWLDIARYADSHGLHADGWRLMWPWRDWVIKSFKDNMSYDKFVTEQLAGDLLDNPSKDQIIATAFNRNHTMTAEGGAIDEEWRLSYVFDRAETFSTAFLGLTMNCAKCHDHKYDPISQDEYYQLTAFFNNVRELGMTGDDGNYGPTLIITEEETDNNLNIIDNKIAAKESEISGLRPDLNSIKNYISKLKSGSRPDDLVGHYPMDAFQIKKNDDGREYKTIDKNKRIRSNGDINIIKGKVGNAIEFDEDYSELYIDSIGGWEINDPFSIAIWINTKAQNPAKTQYIVGNSSEKNTFWRGWEIQLNESNKLELKLVHSKPHNLIHKRSSVSIPINEWTHVAVRYDGSAKANGVDLFINGELANSEVVYDRLYKSMTPISGGAHLPTTRPVRIGKSGRAFTGENGIFIGAVDDLYVYDRKLSSYEISNLAQLDAELSTTQTEELAAMLSDDYKALQDELHSLRTEKLAVVDTLKEIMVMEEEDVKRPTFVYHRGEYTQPLHQVQAETPGVISSFPDHLPENRLGLAQWLFQDDNPLTSRVTVNRYWQMIFGQGLVNTPQDFGLQGAKPSHPELLDYLAIEFQEHNWDVKWLIKQMVMSAAYRQSSIGTESDKETDPANIYLARGTSYRLPAEMIRDNALFASGLISDKIGGESVRPYQPEGLWIEKNSFSHKLLKYKANKGDSLYRRSMYTFVKRTSPHPMMTTFDAPNREVCTVKRESTNTPLQSLVLMNDPQFVEAAKVLSERMQLEGGEDLSKQLTYAFQLATSRQPKENELELLKGLFQEHYDRFSNKINDVKDFLEVGEYNIQESLEPVTTASLAMVANAILNHDEAYMKR